MYLCAHTQTLFLKAKVKDSQADGEDKVTEEEFIEFCDGQADPMLQYIDREERNRFKGVRKKQFSKSSLMGGGGGASRRPSLVVPRYENTYRLEPIHKKFYTEKVSGIIRSVLEEALTDVEYDYATFSRLTTELSDRIKERVKEQLNLPRHKLVSFVSVGQMKDQGVRVGSRCVWNPSWDHYASASFKNKSVFAVGVIYATYFE